jgi:hypothetical protein
MKGSGQHTLARQENIQKNLLSNIGIRFWSTICPKKLSTGIPDFRFVTGVGWRRQGWESTNPVTKFLAYIWTLLFQPLLFGLIGTRR